MQQMVVNTESLGLPPVVLEKIGSCKVLIKEVAEGILLAPVETVPSLRGKYKGLFSTEEFLAQKRADMDFEE